MTAGIGAASQATNGRMMGLGLLQDKHPLAAKHYKYPVAGLQTQGCACFPWDHDLVLR